MLKNYKNRKFLLIFKDFKDISFLKKLKSPPKKCLLDLKNNNSIHIYFENQRWFNSLEPQLKRGNLQVVHKSERANVLLRLQSIQDDSIILEEPQDLQDPQGSLESKIIIKASRPSPKKARRFKQMAQN